MIIDNVNNKVAKFICNKLSMFVIAVMGLTSTLAIAQHTSEQAASQSTLTQIASDTDNSLINSGVFSTGGYYDTTLGAFADGKLSAYLGGSDQHAVALEFVGGANQYRVNTTYGFALTDNQRIKLTYDYLTQRYNFTFDLGDANRWVKQHAVGGAYAYLFNNPYVESMEVGGYYSTSPSQGLSTQTETTDTYVKTNERRIAGATSWHAYTDLALRLWPHSRLSGGMDYDYVHFDTKNRNTKTVNGVGGHVQVEQRLLPQVKVTGTARFQQQQREYLGSVGWLLPSPHGMQLELAAVTDYVDSIATKRHFFTNGARLSVALGTSNGRYAELDDNGKQSLLTWVRTPAVRMNDVLAIADGKVTQTILITTDSDSSEDDVTPSTEDVDDDQSVPDGTPLENGGAASLPDDGNQQEPEIAIFSAEDLQMMGNDFHIDFSKGRKLSKYIMEDKYEVSWAVESKDDKFDIDSIVPDQIEAKYDGNNKFTTVTYTDELGNKMTLSQWDKIIPDQKNNWSQKSPSGESSSAWSCKGTINQCGFVSTH